MGSKAEIIESKIFIKDHSNDSDLPAWQKAELDKRLDYYYNNPNDVMDWEVVKSQLLSRKMQSL